MKRKKRLNMCMLLVAAVLVLTGCGGASDYEVSVTSAKTADYSVSAGYDDDFFVQYASLLTSMGQTTDAQTLKEEFKANLVASGAVVSEEVIGGVNYTMATYSGTNAAYADVEEVLYANGVENACLTQDYFYGELDLSEYLGMEDIESDMGEFKIYQAMSLVFMSPVTNTNGIIDSANPNHVTWETTTAGQNTTYWATAGSASNAATAKVTSVKNKKIYKKEKTIQVSNAENLAKMTLSKLDSSDGDVVSTKTIKQGAVVKANGFYQLTVWSRDGKCQSISFTIDKKKPVISGAKNKKTYKKNVTLKFEDEHSGIKSVTVNGKKISSKKYEGYTIKKNGTYKIVVTDKAGNKKKITIYIKK